jgi:hypothetical protein
MIFLSYESKKPYGWHPHTNLHTSTRHKVLLTLRLIPIRGASSVICTTTGRLNLLLAVIVS